MKEIKPKKSKQWIWIVVGVVVLFIIIIIFSGDEDKKGSTPVDQRYEQEQQLQRKAIEIYKQLIMDNAITVIEKIPEYASQGKSCIYKNGVIIEDPYSAEWYVIGDTIYAVNGLAKSLTPDIEYAPEGISYQKCY